MNSPTQTLPKGGGLKKTAFVNLKSELTVFKELFDIEGYETLRTRMHCNCKAEFNRRDGILIVKGDRIVSRVIRCKACAKTNVKGGPQ